MSEPENNSQAENLEVSLRLLGNEILAFSIASNSSRKNWVVIGLAGLFFTVAILNQIQPIFAYFTN